MVLSLQGRAGQQSSGELPGSVLTSKAKCQEPAQVDRGDPH